MKLTDEKVEKSRKRKRLWARKNYLKRKVMDNLARKARGFKKKTWGPKQRARQNLKYALKTGKVVRPQRCEGCGRISIVLHGHHRDYAKPLSVKWLCTTCHGKIHRIKD